MSTLAFSSGGKTGRSHRPPVRLSHRVHVAGRLVGHAMFAMGLTLAVAGAAHAASTITRTNLTGTTFLNPCTAEQITIVGGTFQLIVSNTTDASGGLHVDIRGSAQGVVATGATTGDSYRLAGDFWSEQTIRDPGYPMTLTIVEVHNAVSASSAQNFIVHIVRHLTIDANGDVAASVESVSAECRG